MKRVGILGGLGPLAGAFFYQRLVQLSPAEADDEHLPVVLVSEPAMPSRVEHLSGQGQSPVPVLQKAIHNLVEVGAEVITIPSSTANLYYTELSESTHVPIIPLVEEVVSTIRDKECRRVGLLGTTPTLRYGLYDEAFERSGVRAVHPDEATQEEVMNIIATVKGRHSDSVLSPSERILEVANKPWARELDGMLLACTEIPVIFPTYKWKRDIELFSVTDILAKATIREGFG